MAKRSLPRRKAKATPGLLLRDTNEDADYTTLDVVTALRGVCVAADTLVTAESDIDVAQQLNMASKILSSILYDLVEV
jgi:hypothetical protein